MQCHQGEKRFVTNPLYSTLGKILNADQVFLPHLYAKGFNLKEIIFRTYIKQLNAGTEIWINRAF